MPVVEVTPRLLAVLAPLACRGPTLYVVTLHQLAANIRVDTNSNIIRYEQIQSQFRFKYKFLETN